MRMIFNSRDKFDTAKKDDACEKLSRGEYSDIRVLYLKVISLYPAELCECQPYNLNLLNGNLTDYE